jgi:phage terminase large subunit-like protein
LEVADFRNDIGHSRNRVEVPLQRNVSPAEKPKRFDQVLQGWDTVNKDTELSNFSVCTTWGIKDQYLFLLDVFRRRMDFPALKRAPSVA